MPDLKQALRYGSQKSRMEIIKARQLLGEVTESGHDPLCSLSEQRFSKKKEDIKHSYEAERSHCPQTLRHAQKGN